VTIDITGAGVKIVSFDLAGNKVTIVVKGTEKLTDKETKCRFLAVHNNLVYITSMLKDRIYVVDLVLKTSWKAAARIKEPTGIAVDPSSGLIYVTSQATKAIEVLDGKGAHLGTLFKDPKQISPLGLAIKNDVLYVANSAQKCITPLKIDFNKFFKTNES
jgi:DNA-binding beta-propeller fold protein YncE